jgi:uncharacterized protein (TIGR02231 family)
MKHLLLSSMSLLACISACAQEYRVVRGKAEEVTVYFSGASVTLSSRISLPAGTHFIVFDHLPSSIDHAKSSIQLPPDMLVLSMQKSEKSKEEIGLDPVLRKLRDSIKLVTDQQKLSAYRIESLNMELSLLKENLYIGGANVGVNITELQKASDFYRVRQADIYKKLVEENENTEGLHKLIQSLKERENLKLFALGRLSAKIMVQVEVAKEGSFEVRLRYFTEGAAWKPIYDIRVPDVGQPMQLVQKGKILNNTGADWDDIKLVLSTADPSLSIIRPELPVWELDYRKRLVTPPFLNRSDDENTQNTMRSNEGYLKGSLGTMVNVSELSNEFTVARPANINTSLMPQTIEIKSYTLNTWYEYTSIPKLEKQPWLIGKTLDWKTLPLSDGPANIYIGNNYIGESYINLGSVNDTLEISLGRNKKVVVEYKKKEDVTKKSWLGGSVTENFTYEISIRNNNNLNIVFELWDQLPVSNDKDIVVASSEISGAALDVPTGKLTWRYTLAPGEEKKIVISYSVRYPNNKPVILNRFKPLRAPDF